MLRRRTLEVSRREPAQPPPARRRRLGLIGDTEWHSGESQGFRNVIIRWPKQHVTVVILSNRNNFKPYPLAVTIGELFLAR